MSNVIQFPVNRTRKPKGNNLGDIVTFTHGKRKITGPIVEIKGEKYLVAAGDINIWQVPKSECKIVAKPPR